MRQLRLLFAFGVISCLAAAPLSADLRPPQPQYELDGNRLKLPAPLAFAAGSAELSPQSAKVINYISAYLQDKTYISLMRIEGHVHDDKAAAAAQRLSEQRALAVVRALVAKGIDCKRLLPVGFGGSKPVASGDSAEGRALNTRVEAVNAQLRGRAIGGMPSDGGGKVAGDPCK